MSNGVIGVGPFGNGARRTAADRRLAHGYLDVASQNKSTSACCAHEHNYAGMSYRYIYYAIYMHL